MILFFDTETTGLPRNWKAPMHDLDNWPRVIQLAWLVTDLQSEYVSSGNFLIKPDGWTIPDGSDPKVDASFWLKHGFSTAENEQRGVPLPEAAERFLHDLQGCPYMVAHNMSYDYNVLGAELMRYGLKSPRKPTLLCTKDASTDYLKLPGKYGYKWPKLEELHRFLFQKEIDHAHDAHGDVTALALCFFELARRGVLKLPPLTEEGGKP